MKTILNFHELFASLSQREKAFLLSPLPHASLLRRDGFKNLITNNILMAFMVSWNFI